MMMVLMLAFSGPAVAQQMSSTNYSIPKLVENNGSGHRAGIQYQISADIISPQPVATSSSSNYSLQGRPLVINTETPLPSCGIFINDDEPLTNTVHVDLSLICGHSSGCAWMQLSNNGVGWSAAMPFDTEAPWSLLANDGTRKVFARYQNGLGNWSGVCFDSIELDTTAPRVSISPIGGTYMSTQQIAVTANEPAAISYTLDGSDPPGSPTSIPYSGPIPLGADGTVRAAAVDGAGFTSAVVGETYEICTGNNLGISGTVLDATRDNAPMPLVVITLDSGHSTNTDLNGNYSFSGLPRGWYTIESVTAPVAGYVTYQSKLKLCMTSIGHDIVLTRSGTVYGTDTNSGYSSNGVNTSTGNYTYKAMDLALPGIGPSFVFERTYNSQDAQTGPLGYGWTWSFNESLEEWPDGEMVMRWGDGKTEVWNPDGGGGWTPMYGVFSTLIENPDGSFTLRGKDLIEHQFDLSNRLAAVVDEYDNTISFNYSGDNLTSVVDTSGRTISFSYDASGRITNILDPIGRSVSFAYDVNGDLISATNMEGNATTFTYDDAHRMLTITDPMGNVAITNSYDEARSAVINQRDALGDETRYLYDVPNRVTTVIDAEGNTYEHHFDDYLRLIEERDARGFSSYRTYDERGNLETATDKNGNVTTYSHDANGNVLTKTEPLGRVTSATYDADNNPITKTDARGYATVFEYDPANGNLLATYACGEVAAGSCAGDPDVLKTAYAYDPLTGQLLTVTQAAGHPSLERTTTYQYDFQGNNVAVIDAMGETSSYTYDAVGRKMAENHPLGRAVAYEYDVMDRLILVTDGLGGVAQYAYDKNGNKTDHWDANGRHTQFTYDAKDRLVRRTDALGQIEEYTYDGVDRRVTVVNPRGATAAIIYDAMGNVAQEIDPTGNVVRYEYDGNGNRTAAINAKGARKELTYNELNLLVAVTDPLGNTDTYQYDLEANQTHATNALGKTSISVFDAFNRVETVTDPEGNSVTNAYDLLGRLANVTDARGHTTSYQYDNLDRLVGVTDADGGTVAAGYDVLGNRTSVTDPRGKVSTFEYDTLNRLVSATDPLGNSVVRQFDPVGNLVSLSNADGTTQFVYDALYRATEVTQPDLTTVTYTYDAGGNRISVTDTAGVTSFAYDMGDRVISVTDPFGNTVGYTYDPNGNRSSIRYPGYKTVAYLFDPIDRVVEVQDWGGVTTTYTYDEAGRLSTQVMGNGTVVTYGYDEAGRLIFKEDRTAGGELIASYTYTLDPNGNPTALDMTQPLMPDVNALDSTYTHNDGNQVVTNNASTYTYDGKGNRVTATTGGVTTTYTYGFNNRLTSVDDGTNLWEYVYTSNGHRIASIENGVEARHLLDLNASMEWVLAELSGVNTVEQYFVYGDGLLYSVDGATGERLFYHYDSIGNTVALSDLTGAVADGYAYSPYGELVGTSAADENPFLFVGRFGVVRESNGLYFMRARFYDPTSGSFLSQDSNKGNILDPQSLSQYTYARSNPYLFLDPNGEILVSLAVTTVVVVAANILLNPVVWDLAMHILQHGAGIVIEGAVDGLVEMIEEPFSEPTPKKYGTECPKGACNGGFYWSGTPAHQHVVISYNLNGTAGEVEPDVQVPAEKTEESGRAYINKYAKYLSVNNGPETAKFRQMYHWFKGDTVALEKWMANKARAPKAERKNLDVSGYAKGQFQDSYRHIFAEDYLDQQTLSYVENRVSAEVAQLSQKRYRYTKGNDKSYRRAKEARAHDVAQSVNSLYGQLISALSKHQVLIRDLSATPSGATGGIVKTGVYAGGR